MNESREIQALSGRRTLKIVWIIIVASVLLLVAFAVDASPLLRGPGEWPPEWRWPYQPHDVLTWRLIIPPIILAGIVGLVSLWKRPDVPLYVVVLVALLGLGLQLTVDRLRHEEQFGPLRRTTYIEHFGYFPPANNVESMRVFLDDFAQDQPNFEGLLYYRVRSHPPGNVVFYWLVIAAHEQIPPLADFVGRFMAANNLDTTGEMGLSPPRKGAALSSGLLVATLAAFAVVPLYFLGRAEKWGDLGRRALVLWPVVVSVVVYIAVADQMMTLLTATCLLLTYLALRDDSPVLMLLAGVVWSVASFATVAVLVLLAIMGIALMLEYGPDVVKRNRGALRTFVLMSAALVVGTLSFWVVMGLWFDVEGVQIARNALGSHNVTRFQRTYWKWALYSPYEFLIYAGVPLTILFLYEVGSLARKVVRRLDLSVGDRLLLVSVAMLVLLVVSGQSRAEVARQWLFLTPIPFWGAIRGAERLALSMGQMAVVAALQLAQIVVFRTYLILFI